jgi:hypothetical protein
MLILIDNMEDEINFIENGGWWDLAYSWMDEGQCALKRFLQIDKQLKKLQSFWRVFLKEWKSGIMKMEMIHQENPVQMTQMTISILVLHIDWDCMQESSDPILMFKHVLMRVLKNH